VTLISFSLAALALLVALPVALFFLEVSAAVMLTGRRSSIAKGQSARERVAVLVPAHNEAAGLLATLADIKAQLRPIDRLVVVADNCSDDTASVAARAGAEVVTRDDAQIVGKGYALARGLDHLEADRPDIVVFIDADCRLGDRAIERLAAACAETHRPVQALYLMNGPADSTTNLKVAEFAWRVKNWVRPLGLKALGLPCQLMGTGMAFPWDLLRCVSLAHGSIVEDLKLGHDLAMAGHPPLFCPSALVTSVFASSAAGIQSQRMRWEHGHIGLILKTAPHLLCMAVRRGNGGLLALALDLSIPPLSFLAMLVVAMSVGSAIAMGLGGSTVPMAIAATSFAGLAAGIALSWLKCGRDVLPPSSLWSIGPYVSRKLGLYAQILSGKPAPHWMRTDRRRS
jgi:cellulose synthase/poly-beta-1,6-N-acetylglucosamine synthase-like glycosyltransferase